MVRADLLGDCLAVDEQPAVLVDGLDPDLVALLVLTHLGVRLVHTRHTNITGSETSP